MSRFRLLRRDPDIVLGLRMASSHLRHDRRKTLLATAGVAFPVVLVLLQLGLLEAVRHTATLVYDALHFDIAVVSSDYRYLVRPGAIPRAVLQQALAESEVVDATPFFVATQFWLNRRDGVRRQLLVMGVDPGTSPFNSDALRLQMGSLRRGNTVLVDELTRPEFGPIFEGLRTELGGSAVEVAGLYRMGTGFAAYGGVVTSASAFFRIVRGSSEDRVNIGLLQIEPLSDAAAVAARLQEQLPPSVRVMTRSDLLVAERDYWDDNTSIGVIFGWGVLVALIVSAVIFYQLLSVDISNHLGQYATMKAIGVSSRGLRAIILWQAALLCVVGFAAGLAASIGVYRLTAVATRLPLAMTAGRAGMVLVFVLGISMVAGLLALSRLERADPADLF